MDMIEANLNHIKFERDGFLIGVFQNETGEFSGLGNILRAEIGMSYKLFGKWSVDPRFGKQYKFKSHETIIPKSTDGIYRYVVRIAKWVGPKTGRALIDTYGVGTLDILRSDPERVSADIKGITLTRAKEIQSHIAQNQEVENTLVELERLIGGAGLRQSLPTDLIRKWGGNAVAMLKENPYRLIEMKQVGFPSADRIAMDRFKVVPQSVFRQQAAIVHALHKEADGEGHVWANVDELIKKVKLLIRCDPGEGLARAIEKGAIAQDGKFVALAAAARDEKYIAKKVKEMLE